MKHQALALLLATVAITGCVGNPSPSGEPKQPPKVDIEAAEKISVGIIEIFCPDVADPLPIVRSCVTSPFLRTGKAPNAKEIKDCVLRAAGCIVAPPPTPEPPRPSVTAASTPSATPTMAPTASAPAVTASPIPTKSGWKVRLLFVNGFGGCNPYPCDPRTPACAAIVDDHGNPRYPVRMQCSGDRTAWYVLPNFEVVEKGAGCYDEPNGPCRPSCTWPACPGECSKCLNLDSPGTPCGHAPSCDDHISCRRNFVGCGCPELGEEACQKWDAFTPHPGSKLTVTGITCTDDGGFAFKCEGAPGTPYTICTEPWPNARTIDGRPIPGGEKHCASGIF